MDQIPDSVSPQQLADAMACDFPVITDIPVVRFGDTRDGTGVGDLYFLVTALIDRAENAPCRLQTTTLICGILRSMLDQQEKQCSDGFIDFALQQMPPCPSEDRPLLEKSIREHLERNNRKLRGALDVLMEHQSGLLDAALSSALQRSSDPRRTRDALCSSQSVASDELINSLGVNRESVEFFAQRAKQS